MNFDYPGGEVANMFFGNNYKNPAKSANETLDQIPGKTKEYMTPWYEAGKNALPGYTEFMQQMMQHPDQIINMLGQGYKKSPGYDWNLKQGQMAIGNAKAAGGMLGTPQHEQESAEMAQGLASKDFNTYMDRVMQGLGIGAGGVGGIVSQGAKSGESLADMIAKVLGQKAQNQFAGTAGENAANAQQQSNLLSAVGSVLAFL